MRHPDNISVMGAGVDFLFQPLGEAAYGAVRFQCGLRPRFSVFGCRFSGLLAGFFNLLEFEHRTSNIEH
jgi:hypothetical protein